MKNILYILLFLPLAGFGQDNYSLSFDGEDDYVKIFDNPIFSLYNITIAAWVRGTDKSESQVIFSNYATTPSAEWYHMFIEEITGKVIFQIDNGEGAPPLITSITDVCDGEWHFIVGVRDVVSGQILVFVDGLEEASMLNSDGIDVLNPHEILIGKQYNFQRNFNGNIDDIQVWNIALSHSEIQSYMNCDPTGDEEGLVGYWNFNEGSGDTVYDISGNENHGIIYGATYSEDVPENNCYGCTDNLATNYDDLAGVNDSSCTYNTYPIEDENFKAYLQSNYPQTIVNDSLNINATLGIVDLNVDLLEILSLDGLQYFYDLINLNCVANNLSTLPELPSQIEYINCQWNQIDSLPNFPESLKNFDGRHNLITVVPELPNTMEVLRVCFNEVTTIPEFPDSLKILFCAYNYEQLTYLPDFPDHLEEVLCFDNEIEQISDIPETMYKFMMQNNSITQIPNIPEGVNILNLTNNPIECVNDYPEQFEVQLGSYPPCSFLDEYTALMDSLSSVIDSLDITLSNLDDCNTEAINALSSLQLALYNWNTIIDLQEGWNMFGYGCPSSIDVAEGLSNHTESILLVKANDGSAYIPEWDFNGIGDFTSGFGYQIKLTDEIEGFSLCDWYVNDIPEDNIVTLQEYIIQLEDSIEVSNAYHIGDLAEGGIIFYVDETGQHGLVATQEDLEGTYEWGCYAEYVDGADSKWIGSGLQNTMDITNQGCVTENGGITAAQAALDAEINGYNDWFLPSKDELMEMYSTIGQGGTEGNIGGFENVWYWSSSEYNSYYAWYVDFIYGGTGDDDKDYTGWVRIIRAF